MTRETVLIFAATYVGLAVGRIPGLKIDRTGIALLGAIAMVVTGVVPSHDIGKAVDLPTILLLYALMIISAQLRLGGFYTRVALRCAALLSRPKWFLLILMGSSAALSALLANDIVCLAFTPVLVTALKRSGLNPLPFLLGLAASSNIGSQATIIGNPQNMLIGQVGRLDFAGFLLWSLPPTLLSLILAFFCICFFYRRDLETEPAELPPPEDSSDLFHPYDRWESGKGLFAVAVLVILFFTYIPRELSAVSVAGLLLLSRKMRSRELLGLIDWHLLTLFVSLFIVIHGISGVGIVEGAIDYMRRRGVNIADPWILTLLSTALSNIVSNVPAVMVLVRFLDPSQPVQWYVLAASSTFAGNLLLIGSIANLIVVEQAAALGVFISFREHARTGIPVTILSLAVLLLWSFLAV